MTERPLANQVAWITGSSRGLGRVMAEELVRLGARVAVHGTRSDSPKTFGEGESMQQVADQIAEACDGTTMPVWCDVTDESELSRVANEIRDNWGSIDILVCCAGGDIGAGLLQDDGRVLRLRHILVAVAQPLHNPGHPGIHENGRIICAVASCQDTGHFHLQWVDTGDVEQVLRPGHAAAARWHSAALAGPGAGRQSG